MFLKYNSLCVLFMCQNKAERMKCALKIDGKNKSDIFFIQSLDPLLAQNLCESPDEQLIRHHEYHSPHESKIATAMRLSQETISNQMGTSHGAKTMTLAELAGLSPKKRVYTFSFLEPLL